MTDDTAASPADGLDRLDALDLAVTQLADAVEVLAAATQGALPKLDLDGVIAQVEKARTLIGTGD